ncbi:MAG: PepSY domain-containing protein [Gammaproteobacteria bacterium]|nr:PepSY domain-containing protein [Gammaproteobacteria bacterium]MBQ0838277.1 PepSY domain-containing protein [Gammaproteobacteria bacterium]
MNPSLIRKTHRWLGLIAAIQLLIWTGSGLFFSIVPIGDVRGSHLLQPPPALRLAHVNLISASDLVAQHSELATLSLGKIQLRQRLYTPIYQVKLDDQWLIYHAETAAKLAPLTETQAHSIATNSTHLPVLSATWVTAVERGSEYRDGELPAWKIALEGVDEANLWIGANSGKVSAMRTNTWRLYDFLWSLHIMDYLDRDNFNSWLLRAFALLGVITIVSGLLLFFISAKRRK